jgi:hypothetical protein
MTKKRGNNHFPPFCLKKRKAGLLTAFFYYAQWKRLNATGQKPRQSTLCGEHNRYFFCAAVIAAIKKGMITVPFLFYLYKFGFESAVISL